VNPTAAKALIYATVIADRLVEKHGPQDDGKTIEHTFEWPTFWPRRLRPAEGKFYQTATEHIEVRIIATPDYCYVRLTYGDRIWRTDEGDPIH
jgi:hypothetical protein